jgi:5'-deoxynucleotidase YfbR-like HD superfamily hydrolase
VSILDLPPIAVRVRLTKQFQAFSRSGDVVRFHTRPQLQPVNVAAHTYGVWWLCFLLMGEQPSPALTRAAMTHDTAEFITGDMPGNTKEEMGGFLELERQVMDEARLPLPELTEDEERILLLADRLAGMRECVKERQLGNQLLATCFERYRAGSLKYVERPHEQFLWGYIVTQWENANHGA